MYEVDDLEHQAKIMFNELHDEPFTAQFKRLKEQLDYVRNTYGYGRIVNWGSLSYWGRLHARSNDEVENLNRTKNRIALEKAGFGRKNCNYLFFQIETKKRFSIEVWER